MISDGAGVSSPAPRLTCLGSDKRAIRQLHFNFAEGQAQLRIILQHWRLRWRQLEQVFDFDY